MSNYEVSPSGKRSGKRLRAELRVYYGPTQQTVLSGFSVDLGSGGLYLQTEYPFNVEDKLMLIFSLPDQEKCVSCQARVSWLNSCEKPRNADYPSGVGLQFVEVSLEDLEKVANFVENYELEPSW